MSDEPVPEFWLVWTAKRQAGWTDRPTVPYATRGLAEREARRMAAKTGDAFYVVRAERIVRPTVSLTVTETSPVEPEKVAALEAELTPFDG